MSKAMYAAMARAIIDGDTEAATALAQQAVGQGIDPLQAINDGFVRGLDEVGAEYGCGNLFLPDLVLAAEAMKAAVAVLEPELARHGRAREVAGTVVIGTVEGDIHDIGKTLVATMLSANGFRVHDLGVNVSPVAFADTVVQTGANLVAVSSLLTTTMLRQRDVIAALAQAGVRARVQVMVGGAPVTQSWADEISADGYSEDAVGAVQLARRLVGAPTEAQP